MVLSTFAAVILVKNEPNIKHLIKDIQYFFDAIVIVIDTEEDPVIDLVRKAMKGIHTIRVVHSKEKDFASLRNLGDRACDDLVWHVHIDCDEEWDKEFLEKKETLCRRTQNLSFKFPRINLPDKKDYPDYQVRMFRYIKDDIEWRNGLHEVLWCNPKNIPVDKVDCVILDRYPIVHSERRTDIKRDWW